MTHPFAMRPSEWVRLSEEIHLPTRQREFLDGLECALAAIRHDGGADTDIVYMTAAKSANAEVWKHVTPERLADILSRVDRDVALAFLSGLSKDDEARVGAIYHNR